jgi:hypothetical protein
VRGAYPIPIRQGRFSQRTRIGNTQREHPPNLQATPLLTKESLSIGIALGKARHIAGFVSLTLLERRQRCEACPALVCEHSREGFPALLERIRTLAPQEHCVVLSEKTGHSHKPRQQYVQDLDLPVFLLSKRTIAP